MFQRELDLAVRHGEELRRHLQAAAEAPRIMEVADHLHTALDAAWRMESALGELLAIEEPKLRAAHLLESVLAARRAFTVLKASLADADEARRRSEAEMVAPSQHADFAG